jgi:hypothetical protein
MQKSAKMQLPIFFVYKPSCCIFFLKKRLKGIKIPRIKMQLPILWLTFPFAEFESRCEKIKKIKQKATFGQNRKCKKMQKKSKLNPPVFFCRLTNVPNF